VVEGREEMPESERGGEGTRVRAFPLLPMDAKKDVVRRRRSMMGPESQAGRGVREI
jgi:hypothetical protein